MEALYAHLGVGGILGSTIAFLVLLGIVLPGPLPWFIRAVDRLNDIVGRAVAWLCLAMVVTTLTVVVLRYAFAIGFVWLQESYVWMHGIVFMVGAAYTLLHQGHVRVDVFYRPRSIRYKAWVDLFGSLFLLMPVLIVVAHFATPYVQDSWARNEVSREAGGLPALYLLKSMLLVFCGLMILQGLSLAARSFLVLSRHPAFVAEAEDLDQVAE